MLFKEFKKTEDYFNADVISFVDTNGEELDIDNLEDEVLDNIEVINVHKNGGYVELTLN